MKITKQQWVLLAGDAVVLLLVNLYGILSHQMMADTGNSLWRTFLPWLAAWVLVGWHVGVFDPQYARQPRQLWRPFWAMILASPLGGFLRGAMLGSDVVVLFVVIFGGFSTLSITAWRALYWFITTRK